MHQVVSILIENGPWAGTCGVLLLIIWRMRKEWVESLREKDSVISAKEQTLEKRHQEALELQAKVYETIHELALTMASLKAVMGKLETTMESCNRKGMS